MPLPKAQFLFRQGIEYFIAYSEQTFKLPTAPLRFLRRDRHQLRIGFARFGQYDFLACMGAVQQFGKMRLGVMDIEDRVRTASLD